MAQLNWQLSPRPRRKLGLGEGIPFEQWVQDPSSQAAQAWDQIQAQLVAEGAPSDALTAAKGAFADAINQATIGLNIPVEEAINNAKSYVLTGQTILGYVKTVQGLVNEAQGIHDAQTALAFTGTLIGTTATIATAAGAVSAGVGAAIVAAAGAIIAVLEELLGPGKPPAGTQVCGGFYCQNADFTVGPTSLGGCVCGWGTAIAPGSADWRSFPDYSKAEDKIWFTWSASDVEFDWGKSANVAHYKSRAGYRPIDAAFQAYNHLEADFGFPFGGKFQPLPYILNEFNMAWISAWKANAAYALNGLKPQDDGAVLMRLLRTWNQAHEDSSVFLLAPVPVTPIQAVLPVVNPYNPATTTFRPPFTTYLEMIANKITASTNDPSLVRDGKLLIHTGPRKTPPVASVGGGGTQPYYGGGGDKGSTTPTAGGSGSSAAATVAKTAGGVGLVTVLGIGAFALVKHVAFAKAAEKLYDASIGKGVRAATQAYKKARRR